MKKFWILFSLFIVPLLFYIFLASGINNFSKLPVVTKNVLDISKFKNNSNKVITLNNKITVICFLGKQILNHKVNALNLNEKIYKHFYPYKDFQMVAILPKGMQPKVAQLKKELGFTTNIENWHFVYGKAGDIKTFFNSLKTNTYLDSLSYTPLSFIIDKDRNLRGRKDDNDSRNGILYGYNASQVSPLHKKMVDDIKIVLAEYRRALKNKKQKI